jgi:hypothetical protein
MNANMISHVGFIFLWHRTRGFIKTEKKKKKKKKD